MNTCIKCGCDDAYPSLPPCPTPIDCPNPQPCAEFFDAQCVRYTLPDIMCGLNIVVAQDSSIAEALESIVLFFCTNFSNSVQSVTGLNTDNTDPLNPIVKVSVDGITITGLGTPASPLIAVAGGVDGSGTLNYLAKWTPDGNTLGNSLIRDDGTTIGIGIAPSSNALLYVSNASNNVAVRIEQLLNATTTTNGAYITNTGINTGENRGLEISVNNSSLINTGLLTVVTANAPATGVGGQFIVTGTSLSKYALRLQDGTEGSGKFLKSITANGEANWANITAADVSGVVGGSGTVDYLARWTPSGTQLGIGLIRDDGTTVGINTAPVSTIQLQVLSSKTNAVVGITNKATGNNVGVYGEANGVGAGQNSGVRALASGGTVVNIGVYGEANGASVSGYGGSFYAINATSTNIGVIASAGGGTTAIGGQFSTRGAGSNYSLKLLDGSEGVGKVLTCMTATGEANWVTPSGGGVSGSGINNYVARWTPDGATLGTGLIRDDNTSVGIGASPTANYRLRIETSTQLYGMYAKTSLAGTGNQVGVAGFSDGLSTGGQNAGVVGLASGNTNINIGGSFSALSATVGTNIGVYAQVQFGANNYAAQLRDGTEVVGRVLTCMTATGEANWATLPTIGGLTWTTLSGTNPSATLAANNGYLIKNTTGAFTSVTLPSSGVVVGDIIKIIATDGGGGSLSTWRILEGSATDVIIYSFYDITTDSEITGVKNTSPLLTFDDNVAGSYTMFRNQSLTLTCVEVLGAGYAWNVELANGKMIS
jgi:hypothetical protein